MSSQGLPPGIPAPQSQDLLNSDTVSSDGAPAMSTQWGLFLNGQPVIQADNFVGIEENSPSDVPDYPIEQGAFGSYNKVQLPFEATLTYSAGGSVTNKQDLFNSVYQAKQSLELYELRMPEFTQENVNVVDFDFERQNGSAGLLVMRLHCREIRQVATNVFTSTDETVRVTASNDPGSNSPQSSGIVQPTDLTPQQMQILQGLPVTDNPAVPQELLQ